MPPNPARVYWDSCVFLSYINGYEERLPTIDALLAESSDRENEREIVSSTFTIVEVAFDLNEQAQAALDSETEAKIDALWGDRYAVKLIEFHEGIARDARTLMRGAVASGRPSLKPGDAIHLASARSLEVVEFHTYSKDLARFTDLTGLKIVEPSVDQPQLFA
ncbi:MAG: type II toxin-antitoxin system VapC family toxin [Actinobacteria bacterium]|nr:MAG: type II toxin-antitoxin system VapC family toxin [Actinomycetota bacterium]